jgi:hypothetical protein
MYIIHNFDPQTGHGEVLLGEELFYFHVSMVNFDASLIKVGAKVNATLISETIDKIYLV